MMAEPAGRGARRAENCEALCGCVRPCLLMYNTTCTHPTSIQVIPHQITCACCCQNEHEVTRKGDRARSWGEVPREWRPRRAEAGPSRHHQYGPWVGLPLV